MRRQSEMFSEIQVGKLAGLTPIVSLDEMANAIRDGVRFSIWGKELDPHDENFDVDMPKWVFGYKETDRRKPEIEAFYVESGRLAEWVEGEDIIEVPGYWFGISCVAYQLPQE